MRWLRIFPWYYWMQSQKIWGIMISNHFDKANYLTVWKEVPFLQLLFAFLIVIHLKRLRLESRSAREKAFFHWCANWLTGSTNCFALTNWASVRGMDVWFTSQWLASLQNTDIYPRYNLTLILSTTHTASLTINLLTSPLAHVRSLRRSTCLYVFVGSPIFCLSPSCRVGGSSCSAWHNCSTWIHWEPVTV